MDIFFEWPASRQPLKLDRRLTAENAIFFNVNRGEVETLVNPTSDDAIVFYWEMGRPVIRNQCTHCICILDDVEVKYGSVNALHPESKIQAGHFRLAAARSNADSVDEETFYQLIYPESRWFAADKVPEVEDILPNGGNYINDRRYFDETILTQHKGGDVLKMLEVEYKRFLVLQEQGRDYFSEMSHQGNAIIRSDDRFEKIREQTKDKTLTECIIDRTYLMEKIWPELEAGEQADELLAVDEKTDLLRLLSPEHIVTKSKINIPELVSQDLRKVGLDTYY